MVRVVQVVQVVNVVQVVQAVNVAYVVQEIWAAQVVQMVKVVGLSIFCDFGLGLKMANLSSKKQERG